MEDLSISPHIPFGLFGGTFDPPHYGHLLVAERIREAFDLQKVLFMPTGIPPHKDVGRVSAGHHRYMMALLATLDNPHFAVSRYEIDKTETSYTVDTLRHIQDVYNGQANVYFIIGVDALLALPTWKEPENVLQLCRMIVVTRPGARHEHIPEKLGTLYEQYKDRIELMELPPIGIAARDIRHSVLQEHSIRYVVPDKVRQYIAKHRLYAKAPSRL